MLLILILFALFSFFSLIFPNIMLGKCMACLHLLAPMCTMMCFLFYNFCDFYRNSAVTQHLQIFENLRNSHILPNFQTSFKNSKCHFKSCDTQEPATNILAGLTGRDQCRPNKSLNSYCERNLCIICLLTVISTPYSYIKHSANLVACVEMPCQSYTLK